VYFAPDFGNGIIPPVPELPEVETIMRYLRQGIHAPPLLGSRIARVTIRWPRHIAEPSHASFRRRIRGRTIEDLSRRGKYFVFRLDRGFLLIHLKMSGDLYMAEASEPLGSHEHTIFHLDHGWDLRFKDARKFGRVYLLEDPQTVLGKLGPEPLDSSFTPQLLQTMLRGRRRTIKHLLLDQSFLAGMGNIYTDEALHRARLHPLRRSDSLGFDEICALQRGIQDTLQAGLHHNGASIDWVYRGGDFQNHFRVYRRAGEQCPVCGTLIERIVVGQRSTHYCPACQPEVLE
jgi:formamidopyrimidine-DNA glycosylase